jgi:hypothetical protein
VAASGDRQRKHNWWQKRTGTQQVALVVALIGVCGGIITAIINLHGGPTINVYAGSASASHSSHDATAGPTSHSYPAITISRPRPRALVGPTPTVSGRVTNIGLDQYVWEFSQPYTVNAPATPLSAIYPYEECSISSNRKQFTCPEVFNGDPNGDYCRYARLWVAVVNAADVNWLSVHSQKEMPIAWPNPPNHTDGVSASVLIQRYPKSGNARCL